MSAKNFNRAVKTLKSGGVIAFPTETVFGIGALLSKPEAIKRIYKLKKRPRSKPLQVLVASLPQALELGKFSKQALELGKKDWPGPLTLIVHKTAKVPKLITGGTEKVGLRIPAHRTIIDLVRKCGPIVATSANEAGEKPSLTAKEVKQKLAALDYILPGRVKHGKPSKVIDATGRVKVLRS
ncbi:MAG: L-threonylcarbamoyladenylate synthase [Candidatus Margulisbacteria bacterium]|nr:L-threonylcarbamoyladenylate synthase [Candidatus Margulisiibacteriota bacterium]